MEFCRCLICGDVYMGQGRPSNCPYCGAQDKYLVPMDEWVDENKELGQVSEISSANLARAMQLEVNNTAFYRDAMNKTRDLELQGLFKYLASIEKEHASTIDKILKTGLAEPEPGKGTASDNDLDNLAAAHQREESAAAFYKQAAAAAIEPRIKKIFTALSEIEADHVVLEQDRINRMNKKG